MDSELKEVIPLALTFRGGVHLAEHKHTAGCAIEVFPAPELLYLPMQQHIGAPATPLVKAGEEVLRGQLIGIADKGLGAHVHSPVSGVVEEIRRVNDASGRPVETVVIRNDGENRLFPGLTPSAGDTLTVERLAEIVRDAGISGLGGATFPTHVKISSAKGKAERIIINCAECEPYITANHRLMLEEPGRIIRGLEILLAAFGLTEGILAVEDNKPDAIAAFSALIPAASPIRVVTLKTKYPQGDERQLVYALLKKEIPAGKLPADLGCVIFNAETCAAIASAVDQGLPLLERVVTVDGDCIASPKNLLVPLGTPFSSLIAYCGLAEGKTVGKVVSGGPMMGHSQYDIHTPVVKGTAAVLVFAEEEKAKIRPAHCIRCGRCVANCPMRLMPLYLTRYAKAEDWANAERYGVMSCVECGSCTYICPGNMPLVSYIRIAKGKIGEINRKKAALAAAQAAEKEASEKAAAEKAAAETREKEESTT